MLSTILCILVSLLAIFYFFNNRELYKKTNHFPGPFSLPLIGCAYKFIGDAAHFMTQIIRMSNKYKSPFRVIIGSRIFLFTKDPEHAKTILQSSKTIEKDDIYDFAKPWLGDGLVTAKHKLWRKHRKIIQPTFNKNVLKSFISIFQKNSLLLTKVFEKEINGPEFEITPHVAFLSVSNICETSIGVSVETQREEVEQFYIFSKRVFYVLFSRLIRIWLHPDFLFNLSSLAKSFNGYVTFIHNFIDEIIQKKRKELQIRANKNQEDSLKVRKRTLDLLLELPEDECFSDKELRDEVVTLITAATDTTSRAISFVFLMLANYPEVQEKVYEEIYNIYGSDDPEKNPVKYEDLHQFMYLERVIMETMRLFPVAPLIGRLVLQDIELDGQTVPKGCSVFIFALGLHRNEKIWPDPLKFDPDRFLPDEVARRHPCAFIPFSFGSKDCIGRNYAMLSMKVLIVTLLRKYILKKDTTTDIKDIKLKFETLLLCSKPITLRIKKR